MGPHLGNQVEILRDRLFELEHNFKTARILLAPLERLMPIEEDTDIEGGMFVPWDEDFEIKGR